MFIYADQYPTDNSEIFIFFCALGYQVFLMRGLNLYLLSEERGADIISQNKEGIYSIFGEKNPRSFNQLLLYWV